MKYQFTEKKTAPVSKSVQQNTLFQLDRFEEVNGSLYLFGKTLSDELDGALPKGEHAIVVNPRAQAGTQRYLEEKLGPKIVLGKAVVQLDNLQVYGGKPTCGSVQKFYSGKTVRNDMDDVVPQKILRDKTVSATEARDVNGRIRQTFKVYETDQAIAFSGADNLNGDVIDRFRAEAATTENAAFAERLQSYVDNYGDMTATDRVKAAIDFYSNSEAFKDYTQVNYSFRIVGMQEDGTPAVARGFLSGQVKMPNGNLERADFDTLKSVHLDNAEGKDLERAGDLSNILGMLNEAGHDTNPDLIVEVIPVGMFRAGTSIEQLDEMGLIRHNDRVAAFNPTRENGEKSSVILEGCSLAIRASKNSPDYFFVNNSCNPVPGGRKKGEGYNPWIGGIPTYNVSSLITPAVREHPEIEDAFKASALETSQLFNRNNWGKAPAIEEPATPAEPEEEYTASHPAP